MCQIGSRPLPDDPVHAKPGKQWLDMKVFCLRLNASGFISKSIKIPETLTLHFLPRSNLTVLEIKGRRVHPFSSAFLTLQRNPNGRKSEGQIAYMGSDSIRTSDNLCFEVYLRDNPLIFGRLEKIQETSEEVMPKSTWTVECSSRLEYSSKWCFDAMSIPTVSVYVEGQIWGIPVIVTQTLQLLPRRKRSRQCTLDVIPEANETAESCSNLSDYTELEDDYYDCSFPELNSDFDCNCDGDCDCDCDWVEIEEQEDSWIEAGWVS